MAPKNASGLLALCGGLLLLCVQVTLALFLNQILTACLGKLEKANTISVQQSLLLVFGQLMCENVKAVLDFLAGVNATEFLLKLFSEKYVDFFGYMEKKIGAIALSALLKHLIETDNQKLMMMTVNGDQIVQKQAAGKRVTRSQAANNPVVYKQIPLIVKLYKILLSETQLQIDRANNVHDEITASDGSEDDDWVEEGGDDSLDNIENIGPDGQPSEFLGGKEISANAFLDGALNFVEDDEDFYDEFEKADNPFGNVEVVEHVSEVVRNLPFNAEMKGEFSEDEMRCAGALGIC